MLQDYGLLTDENIPPEVVAYLRSRGCDVLDVKEASLMGTPDQELIALARAQRRVILTHDRDFGQAAVAALAPMVGIVFLRPGHADAEFTIGTLGVVLSRAIDVAPPFTIVAKRTASEVIIRIRQL